MNKYIILALALASFQAQAYEPGSAAPSDPASNILGGEEGDACQIKLCLSNPAGQDLGECEEPLQKWERTRPEDRPELLKKCPMVGGQE